MENKKNSILVLLCFILGAVPLIGCSVKNDIKTEKEIIDTISIREDKLNKSEVTPTSKAQKDLFESFQLNINNKYNKFSNIEIENEGFEDCLTEVKILSFDSINKNSSKKVNQEIYDDLNKENFYNYEIIDVCYNVTIIDECEKITPPGNGMYAKSYVMVTENEGDNWTLFGIY